MHNNLGRDKLPFAWSEERWKLIDKTVHDEAKQIKVAERVFPVRPDLGAVSVPADLIEEARFTAEEGAELPYVEISREFNLTDSQCEQEAELGTAVMLSRLATVPVALAADEIIFKGIKADLPQGVKVLRQKSADEGLLGLADSERRTVTINLPKEVKEASTDSDGKGLVLNLVDSKVNGQGKYGEAIFNALSFGIEKLRRDGQPPPYLLLLSPNAFAETYQTMPGTFTFAAERIEPLAEGGFHQVPALPPDTGFLVSLPGEPIRIAVSQDETTEYRQPSATVEGEQKFRVVSRYQYLVRDPKAFLKFNFLKDGSGTISSGTASAEGIRSALRMSAADGTADLVSRLEDKLGDMEKRLAELTAAMDGEAEEINVSDEARGMAEELGLNLREIAEFTGSGNEITVTHVGEYNEKIVTSVIEELGVDPESLIGKGTGPDGMYTVDDVKKQAEHAEVRGE